MRISVSLLAVLSILIVSSYAYGKTQPPKKSHKPTPADIKTQKPMISNKTIENSIQTLCNEKTQRKDQNIARDQLLSLDTLAEKHLNTIYQCYFSNMNPNGSPFSVKPRSPIVLVLRKFAPQDPGANAFVEAGLNPTTESRIKAAQFIYAANLNNPKMILLLQTFLKESEEKVKTNALWVLTSFEVISPDVVAASWEFIEKGDVPHLSSLCAYLAKADAKNPKFEPLVLEGLINPKNRAHYFRCIGELETLSPKIRSRVIENLKETEVKRRVEALAATTSALGKDVEITSLTLSSLDDSNLDISLSAMLSIRLSLENAKQPNKVLWDALIGKLGQNDLLGKRIAEIFLELDLDNPEVVDYFLSHLSKKDVSALSKARIINVLSTSRPTNPRLEPALIEQLKDQDKTVKAVTLFALQNLNYRDVKLQKLLANFMMDNPSTLNKNSTSQELVEVLNNPTKRLGSVAMSILTEMSPLDSSVYQFLIEQYFIKKEDSYLFTLLCWKPLPEPHQLQIVSKLLDKDEPTQKSAIALYRCLKEKTPKTESEVSKKLKGHPDLEEQLKKPTMAEESKK